jgi:hypothetical protein
VTPEESQAQKAAFIASIPRRAAALAGVEAACPFDPMSIANTFIARMQEHTNVVQTCHTYAEAMLAIEPGAREAWEKLNAETAAISWPYGLAGIQRMAAEINRKKGAMPCPNQ